MKIDLKISFITKKPTLSSVLNYIIINTTEPILYSLVPVENIMSNNFIAMTDFFYNTIETYLELNKTENEKMVLKRLLYHDY